MSLILELLKSTTQKHNLTSLFYKIDNINFFDLLNQLTNFNNVISFFNPKDKISFIAVGETQKFQTFAIERNSNVDKNTLERFPLFIGYKKFSEVNNSDEWNNFSFTKWIIPKFLIIQNDNEKYLIHNFYNDNYDENDFEFIISLLNKKTFIEKKQIEAQIVSSSTNKEHWIKIINQALTEISNKKIDKVVLARQVDLQIKENTNYVQLIFKLFFLCNDCVIFSIKENDSIFFGATPEKLFTVDKNKLKTEALAGSTTRSVNGTEDAFFAHQLLTDQKELSEQKKVLDYILLHLNNFCEEVKYNEIPFIKKLNTVQHLQTKITATTKNNFDILKFLDEFHPTPAVCGLPKIEAYKLIANLENFDRGLYSGVIGWFNEFNIGDFYVAIRSALLNNNLIKVYAGCGIVEGSIPEKEFLETEIKMKPILSLFSL